jgi:hypothetical protein
MAQDLDKELGFEPISDDQIGFEPEVQDQVVQPISKAESALEGAKQLGSFGFSDELAGLLGSGLDLGQQGLNKVGLASPSPVQVNQELASQGMTGDLGPQSILDQYRQFRDQERQKSEQAQEQNPGSYLAGGLPSALLTGSGVGLVPSVLSGAVGLSDADVTKGEVGQLGKDVAIDSAIAAATLGTGKLAGKSLKALSKTDMAQNLLDSFKLAKAGKQISGEPALKAAQEGLENLSKDARDATTKYGLGKATNKRALLEEAEKAGKTVDIQDSLQQFADEVGSSKSLSTEDQTRLNRIAAEYFKSGSTKSPLELEKMLREVVEINPDFQGPAYRILKNLKTKLRGTQDLSIPEIAPLNKDISENLSLSESLLGQSNLDKMLPEDIPQFLNKNAKKFGKYTEDVTGTQLDIDKLLNEGLPNDFGGKTRSLKELNPTFANKFEQDLQEKSKLFNLSKTANEKIKGSGLIDKALGGIDKIFIKAGESAGQATKSGNDLLQNGIKKISEATPETLKQFSSKMREIGGKTGENFAKVIDDMQGKTPQSKNAIIFSLMQQPEFRKMFHEVNGNE